MTIWNRYTSFEERRQISDIQIGLLAACLARSVFQLSILKHCSSAMKLFFFKHCDCVAKTKPVMCSTCNDKFTPTCNCNSDVIDVANKCFQLFDSSYRNCIGQNFAMNEMKITVAHILINFELSVDDSVEVIPIFAITLRAWEGIKLFVKPRELNQL